MDQDSPIVHRSSPLMDQDSPIAHRREPPMDQDSPIVHWRPHAQTKMQALVAHADIVSMFVPISVLEEAPLGRPPLGVCISDDVPLLEVAC